MDRIRPLNLHVLEKRPEIAISEITRPLRVRGRRRRSLARLGVDDGDHDGGRHGGWIMHPIRVGRCCAFPFPTSRPCAEGDWPDRVDQGCRDHGRCKHGQDAQPARVEQQQRRPTATSADPQTPCLSPAHAARSCRRTWSRASQAAPSRLREQQKRAHTDHQPLSSQLSRPESWVLGAEIRTAALVCARKRVSIQRVLLVWSAADLTTPIANFRSFNSLVSQARRRRPGGRSVSPDMSPIGRF